VNATPAPLFRTPRHSPLVRPRATFVDSLPEGATVNVAKTPWQHIADLLVSTPGQWLMLHRTYTSPANAVSSARKVLETDHNEELAVLLQSAYEPAEGGFRVYLRLPAELPDEEDDGA
jgi:hypothetical protein